VRLDALVALGGNAFFIDTATCVRHTLNQSRLPQSSRASSSWPIFAGFSCEPRMASSLPLTASAPDPEQNLSRQPDEQKTNTTEIPALNGADNSATLAAPSDIPITSASDDIFAVLRRSIADESQPPDSMIRATTEAARVLTAADGVAIAFRNKGVILCRARSGDLAPDLGSYVNANSGISGECLRTASILVCEDAGTDPRVDHLVCERMGIRSIVVVPLRGPVGISGILEVFARRVNAFGSREINALRGLAELAEAAYERERRAQQEAIRAALRSAHRLPALFGRSAANESESDGAQEFTGLQSKFDDPRPEPYLWAIGVAVIALLLIAGVWLSWHGPISELAELEAAENHNVVQAAPKPKETIAPPKPTPAIVRAENQKARHWDVAKSSSAEQSQAGPGSAPRVVSAAKVISDAENSAEPVQPPTVKINAAANRSEFASLLADRETLPVMAGPISHGVTGGELIRKVEPVYPPEARAERITGSVVLEIRVSQDGTVRNIRSVSGEPQLVRAAVEAVRQWRYAPTLLDGRPIETSKQITVLFKLP
jgi:TonB family protein